MATNIAAIGKAADRKASAGDAVLREPGFILGVCVAAANSSSVWK
ncbi:hypothetical protein [Bradyrhizobium sp. JYMT SZCCT0428]|nr:hypothetical protein [Bradyrhizobium sp. JYMT SZCCT0428]